MNAPLLLLTILIFFLIAEYFLKNGRILILALIITGVFLIKNLVLFFVLIELRVIPFLYLFMTGEYPERFERVLWMVLYMFFFGLPFITIVLIGADKDTFDLSPLLIVFIGKLPIFGMHY